MGLSAATLISLGIAAAGATAGAIGSAANNRKAKQERARIYDQSRNYLNSEYYRDPLSTVGNRSLLKSLDKRMADQNEAMQNRAIAGGATMENQLAAKQVGNRTIDDLYTRLLQGEDARRAAIGRQKMQLDSDYSSGVQAGYLQDAQNWQAWGSQMANSALAYGSSSLLDAPASSPLVETNAKGGYIKQ